MIRGVDLLRVMEERELVLVVHLEHRTKYRCRSNKLILAALDQAGGEEGGTGYLRRLAIENSSAFASLLGKVLPTTLAADESSGGASVKMTFERVIVWPDGRREIEGVTPKSLPAPDGDKDQ